MATRLWLSCNNNETLQPNPNTLQTPHMFNLNFIMANTITESNKCAYTNTSVRFQFIMANTMTDSNKQAYTQTKFCAQVEFIVVNYYD